MKIAENHIFLDAALIQEHIYEAKKINSVNDSLYRGNSEQSLEDVAPYLFSFVTDSDFYKWYLQNGWGRSWGLIIRSKISLEEVNKHFRKFLLVKTEDGKELYFRFYDPRVLKIFLPTCDKNQILEFFGPIESFICEGETKEEAIRFWQENGELKQEILPAEKIFGKITATETTDLS